MLQQRLLAGHMDIERLSAAGGLLDTQDNRFTAHPMFLVQQRHRIIGLDEGFADGFEWIDEESQLVTDTKRIDELNEAEWCADSDVPDGYTRIWYRDIWEFVTACFTRQGCEEYLRRNGYKLKSPRIYVETGQHNLEWQRMRTLLRHVAQLLSPAALAAESAVDTKGPVDAYDAAGGRREKMLTVRMSHGEMGVLHRLSVRRGVTASALVRQQIRAAADDDTVKPTVMSDELASKMLKMIALLRRVTVPVLHGAGPGADDVREWEKVSQSTVIEIRAFLAALDDDST